MEEIIDPINETAKKYFNIDYVFPYQRLVISNILRAAEAPGFETEESFREELSPQQVVLLPTGAGKSLCFMIPAFLFKGITIVIFPLLSLLSDQQRRTVEAGLPSAILRGGQSHREREEIFRKCRNGDIKMLLTNPETLKNESVLIPLRKVSINHIVIDEAHTVSEWGDTFRPAYLELSSILQDLSPDLVTAFTATASQHILNRIHEVLFPGESPNVVYGNPDRPNISYSVIQSHNPSYTLVSKIKEAEKPLIVFASSRTATELTARLLRRKLKSDDVYFYHAGLTKEEKDCIENWFFDSDSGILVATCAYGMGVDKKNIRTVIHIDTPSTVESYLQESGRAGRDRNPSQALLIYNPQTKNRLMKIDNSHSRQRFNAMITYGEDKSRCRRESLLAMLGSSPEICSGCDVCSDTVEQEHYAEDVIELVKKRKKKFTKRELIHYLKGYKTIGIKTRLLHELPDFGVYSYWDSPMIEELIDNLLRADALRIPSKGFGKHRLTI